MLTLAVQLLVVGFLVGVVFHYVAPRSGTGWIAVDLVLGVLGAFLGTVLEVFVRSVWDLPLLVHLAAQFVLPALAALGVLVLYRLSNGIRD